MLRITVELVPYGREEHAQVIARGTIINDGTGSNKSGNYDCSFAGKEPFTEKQFQLKSKVKNFSRVRNVWSLICEAISNVKE